MRPFTLLVFLLSSLAMAQPTTPPTPSTTPSPATSPTTKPTTARVVLEPAILDYAAPTDPALQKQLEAIDAKLRARFKMTDAQAACGVVDLNTGRVAMIHPDRIEYAASTAKIGILYAYFATHPEAATNIDPTVKHELGEMAKASSNEMAAKYSQQLGLENIQRILNDAGFYDARHGGGIWVGKHYGIDTPRFGDPVGDNSHGMTVRQALRFFTLLEQGKLVSPTASKTMREIFESPDIPHDDIKFVKALKDRPGMQIIRKWGSWEDWLHDIAVINAPGRHYVIVAITKHPKGDDYCEAFATAIDDVMQGK